MKLSGILLQTGALLTIALTIGAITVIVRWTRPEHLFNVIGPLKVFGTEFEVGGWLDYQMSYCKSTSIDAEEHYSWVDGIAYSTPGMAVRDLPQGCHTTIERVMVPRIPSGTYHLEMVRVYQPTPLRRVELHASSNLFTVVNKESVKQCHPSQPPR